MQLNKEEIIFRLKHDPTSPTGYVVCDYCGISAFAHKHAVGTLPKDFIKVDECEVCWKKNCICFEGKEDPNCKRCGTDISSSQLRKDGITLCHECEDRLEVLKKDLDYLEVGLGQEIHMEAPEIKVNQEDVDRILGEPTAVERIIEDLKQRRGLKQEWEDIDEDIKEEIIRAWELIVSNTAPKIKPLSLDRQEDARGAVFKIKIDWKELIYTDGKIDEEKVMNELHDFEFLMKQATIVYDEIAGLSKTTYTAKAVLGEHEQRCLSKGIVKDDVKVLIEGSTDIEELKKELKNYLEIN